MDRRAIGEGEWDRRVSGIDVDFRRQPRFSPVAEIFAGGQVFRWRPRFSSAAEIFAGGRDFRRRPDFRLRPRFSSPAEIFIEIEDFHANTKDLTPIEGGFGMRSVHSSNPTKVCPFEHFKNFEELFENQ